MNNKFTKSVLERQAKEAKLTGTSTTTNHDAKDETCENKEQLTLKKDTELTLDTFLLPEISRNAKNKTFYLDESVINALHKNAIERKTTDSKLVNDILKKILGV